MSHDGALTDLEARATEYVGPYVDIYFKKITHWETHHFLAFAVIITVTCELIVSSFPLLFGLCARVQMSPKLHLDKFTLKDKAFILFNKISIVVYAHHMFLLLNASEHVKWKVTEATIANTVLVVVPMYLLYDLVYAVYHKMLHMRCIYGYVHKHHHRQAAPSRGHYDAINVHPIEFLLGEYLHLFVFWCIPCHIFAVGLFFTGAIILANLNHTRYDFCIPGIYDAKDHLVHHRVPDTNFGQYTMFWDKVFGWHRGWNQLSKSS
mmetsp:Transcript_72004/g.217800  ORF Transcript_72004/g.217800 Transcript_72004/m.217800 type:complete len:264 (-) Transcript_72004:95-886(-)